MNTRTHTLADLIQNLTDDERALLAPSADMVARQSLRARKSVGTALTAARETCATTQKKAVQTARVADKVVRENPYRSIGSAFFVGFALGFLITRQLR